MRRLLKIAGLFLVLLLLVLGGFALNRYLSETNRFPYSTGSGEKSFLNATWKMSPHEIERANKTALASPADELWEVFGPSVMDKKRYKELVQQAALWGYSA